MQDVLPEEEEEDEDAAAAPEAKRAAVGDLRELLPKRSEPSTGLFSAAAAGLPDFIALGDEDAVEPHDAADEHTEAVEAAEPAAA